MVTDSKVFDCKWETIPFNQYFTLIPTNTFSREQLCDNGEIGNIHYGDVLIKYGCILSKNNYIPRLIDTSTLNTRHYLKKNDVIIADTAEDETVGKAVQVGDINMPLVSGLHTIACRPNYPTADGFLGYYINSKCYHEQILPYVTGIKVSSISKKTIGKTELHIPKDVKEQQAIASVLSDFDEHIDNLTELIEKKKAIRDGALEDLLSGRTRLDGFDGEWEKKPVSEICDVFDGTHQTPKYSVSGIKFVSVENITDIYSSNKYISKADYERDFKVHPEKGDVLMTRIGDIGTSCIVKTTEPIAYYVSLALFKNIIINSEFLNHYIKSKVFKNELDDRTLHHATPKKINKGEIGKCKVCYPIHQEEQQAIASVLTVMDEEIESLEIEKAKMMQIREGAMDDLLTGRVRLKV